MEAKLELIKEVKTDCPFCHGTGIAKCFDFAKNENIPDGLYLLADLIDKYGYYTECPEGCLQNN